MEISVDLGEDVSYEHLRTALDYAAHELNGQAEGYTWGETFFEDRGTIKRKKVKAELIITLPFQDPNPGFFQCKQMVIRSNIFQDSSQGSNGSLKTLVTEVSLREAYSVFGTILFLCIPVFGWMLLVGPTGSVTNFNENYGKAKRKDRAERLFVRYFDLVRSYLRQSSEKYADSKL